MRACNRPMPAVSSSCGIAARGKKCDATWNDVNCTTKISARNARRQPWPKVPISAYRMAKPPESSIASVYPGRDIRPRLTMSLMNPTVAKVKNTAPEKITSESLEKSFSERSPGFAMARQCTSAFGAASSIIPRFLVSNEEEHRGQDRARDPERHRQDRIGRVRQTAFRPRRRAGLHRRHRQGIARGRTHRARYK